MEPQDDPELSKVLKEWRVTGAPPSLDTRVLGRRTAWWSFVLTGSIRVPVPVGIALAALVLMMAATLIRQWTAPPQPAPVSLVDFRPVADPHVRVIGGHL